MLATAHSPGTSASGDSAYTELSVMRSVVAALEGLPDNKARLRAIWWAARIFGMDEAGAPEPAAPAPPVKTGPPRAQLPTADEGLSVDGLESLFGQPCVQPGERFATLPVPCGDGEWTRSATAEDREWTSEATADAAAMGLGDDFVPDEPPSAPMPELDQSAPALLHAFVVEFQQLARDWRASASPL